MDEQVALVTSTTKNNGSLWTFEENALHFSGELTFEQWRECGEVIARIGKGVHWWIGDWINYGRERRWEHTPRYQEAIARTGFDYGTLKNDVAVAYSIEKSRRRDFLSFSHHSEVASYDPKVQELLLDEAERQKWSSKKLRHQKEKFLASIVQANPVEETPDNEEYPVYECAIADLRNKVAAKSLDAIITDPPYPREFLPVYADLANFAIHALKDGGSLIAMVGQSYLPEILDMLRKPPLTYHWLACYYIPGFTTKQWQRNIGISWKPLLWFVKGEYTGTWKKDVVREDIIFIGEKKEKQYHAWGQPEHDMVNIIEHFTTEGQVICDPFVGGGATAVAALAKGRRFVGADILPSCVQTTRRRLRDQQKDQKESEAVS